MRKQLWEQLCATKIFFFVRLVAAMVVGIVYLFVAAGVQYFYVSWFGETTFNYIVGGALSLYLGALACTYLGKLLFMFVRGWHVGAIAFSKQIKDRNLPALDVGMTVFKKHFSSFATVYGAGILIKKFARKGTEELWGLLEDVPYLSSLKQFSKNPIVVKVGEDILDTAFDGIVYYLVKYTKPGFSDDTSAFPEALKRYLYALPRIMISSISLYLILYAVPKIIRMFFVIALFVNNGIVAGILLNVLAYPLFYVIKHAIFEPLETMILISCYSKYCTEDPEENSVYESFVNNLLDVVNLGDVDDNADSEDSKDSGDDTDDIEEYEEDDSDIVSDTPGGSDSESERNSVMDSLNSILNRGQGQETLADISSLPLVGEEDDVDEEDNVPLPRSLNSLLEQANRDTLYSRIFMNPEEDASQEDMDDLEPEDDTPPITRISSMLNSLSPDIMNEAFGDTQADDTDGENGNLLGGGHIDIL